MINVETKKVCLRERERERDGESYGIIHLEKRKIFQAWKIWLKKYPSIPSCQPASQSVSLNMHKGVWERVGKISKIGRRKGKHIDLLFRKCKVIPSFTGSVTSKKSPNVYKSCPKMISLEKWMILTPLQKLPKNVGDLGKFIVAKGFQTLPKVQ